MGVLARHYKEDKFRIMYFVFILLGTAQLSAWNALISAADFFSKRLPTTQAMNLLLIMCNVGCIPVMIITTIFSSDIDYITFTALPLLLMGIVMICTPLICTFLANTYIALVLMMLISFICGVASGITNCSIFGLGAIFSGDASGGIMVGQGIAGLISLIPLVLHLAIPGDNTDISGLIFFSFGSILNILALVSLILFRILPHPRYVIWKHQMAINPSAVPLMQNSPYVDDDISVLSQELVETRASQPLTKLGKAKQFAKETVVVTKKLGWWAVSVFVVYGLTLTLYPSVILAIPPPNGMFATEWSSSLWTHIKINIFCVADFISRWLGDCVAVYKSTRMIVIITFLRFVLAAFLFLALWVKWMRNLVFFIIIYSLFSLSNGYHGTVIMAHANTQCNLSPHELGLGGSVMSMLLNIGIAVGCVLALPLGLIKPIP
ncbi:Equilibrative Nucleoside Transporter [Blattamonas nauphoetae]|uniref:Equilibrative Nucleoside Transporter n=1 Tax=Blattamonas nauphoetae TaxID=2049346 RepID=A0ABQ9XGH1_9EUKA|nr:Equilibrative Nucleoside Transporter [Blattamonas nauphoetae]